jgi:hypothetical protein
MKRVSLLAVAVFVAHGSVSGEQASAPRVPPGEEIVPPSQWTESTKTEVAKIKAGQKKWPPLFPSPFAKKVFENERIIVRDETLTAEHRLHKHIRDIISFYVEDDGDLTTIQPDGTVTLGKLGTRYGGAEVPHVSAYVKAGLGPHSTATADPKKGTRRVFWVEFKGTEPADCKEWSTAC